MYDERGATHVKSREIRRGRRIRSDQRQHESVGENGIFLSIPALDGVSKASQTVAGWRMFETQVGITQKRVGVSDREVSDAHFSQLRHVENSRTVSATCALNSRTK